MRLASIIDVSLVDVPGVPVTVLFTGGCNFDCPYCQNAELIPRKSGDDLAISEIVKRARGNMVDGYCITGGEPTIHKDLPDLLCALKEDGAEHVNLNTQGSVPDVLKGCLPYLDSVWFDIKTTPSKYRQISRTRINPWRRVEKSMKIMLNSDVAFWPRTTYVGNLMTTEDILGILQILSNIGFKGEYVVQNYIESAGTRSNIVANYCTPTKKELEPMQEQ